MLNSYYFDMIAGWTDTPLLFVTRVFDQPKNRLETLCLQTKQGKSVSTLLQTYVDAIVASMKK